MQTAKLKVYKLFKAYDDANGTYLHHPMMIRLIKEIQNVDSAVTWKNYYNGILSLLEYSEKSCVAAILDIKQLIIDRETKPLKELIKSIVGTVAKTESYWKEDRFKLTADERTEITNKTAKECDDKIICQKEV